MSYATSIRDRSAAIDWSSSDCFKLKRASSVPRIYFFCQLSTKFE